MNHIIKSLKKKFPALVNILSKLHVQPSKYHGRQYEGNQCKLILRFIERLRIPSHLKEYKTVLLALRKIHTLCNSDYLPCNYTQTLDQFSDAWFILSSKFNVSTTPKIHIILDHLCDYFDEMEMTLKSVTDELTEQMHQFVEMRIVKSGYKVKDVTSIAHGRKLFRAIRHLNCFNLRIKS